MFRAPHQHIMWQLGHSQEQQPAVVTARVRCRTSGTCSGRRGRQAAALAICRGGRAGAGWCTAAAVALPVQRCAPPAQQAERPAALTAPGWCRLGARRWPSASAPETCCLACRQGMEGKGGRMCTRGLQRNVLTNWPAGHIHCNGTPSVLAACACFMPHAVTKPQGRVARVETHCGVGGRSMRWSPRVERARCSSNSVAMLLRNSSGKCL